MSSESGPPSGSGLRWSDPGVKGRSTNRDNPQISGPRPAVLIATQDPQLRAKWRRWLENGYPVLEISDRDSLESSIEAHTPNVLFLDLDFLKVDGLGEEPIIRRIPRGTRVVLFSGSPNEREGIRVLKAGARGYCNKDSDPQLLRKIVDRVHEGEIWAERRLFPRLLEEYVFQPEDRLDRPVRSDSRLNPLTPREREIAFLIGAGASNKEIASRLGVGEGTVKAHLTAVFRKLGFSDRLHLGLFLVNQTEVPRRSASTGKASHDRQLGRVSS